MSISSFIARFKQIVMPNYGWRWLIAFSSAPSFIVLLLYGLVPESPRYLCLKGRTHEARKILEKAASLNGTALLTGRLVADKQTRVASESTHLLSDKKEHNKSSIMSVLFSPKLIRTNILIWFLYFGNTFSYYGIVLLTSELSGDQRRCTALTFLYSEQNKRLYLDVFVTSLAGKLQIHLLQVLLRIN